MPICEVLGAVTANSAFHGTRLDVEHIGGVMEKLLEQAEARGVDRHAIAANTVFVSHETYTPARGGSASAEIHALRRVFGPDADALVITNTKGFTGHAMGAGIEDVVAIKALETGVVPPVPNYKVPDPELGHLNLSTGGSYPVQYALRLGAGFGSQIAMTLMRWTPVPDGRHRLPDELGYQYRIVDEAAWRRWLAQAAGSDDPQLEVVQHRLRIVDTGPPAKAAPSVQQAPAVQTAPVATETVLVGPGSAPVAATTAAPPPTAPAAAPAPVASAPHGDELTDTVVGIVSELTGYPPDLLDVDLDLEADLGVDTVKQAEIFAAIRGHYGVARDDTLKLRDFPTLTHVIGWIRDKTGAPAPEAAPAPAAAVEAPAAEPVAAPAAPAPAAGDDVTDTVVGIVSELTGYPPDLLDVDLDLEADLGVDTVKQAEIFAAIRGHYGVARDDTLKLRDFPTLTHVIGWIRDKTGTPAPAPAAEAPAAAPVPEAAPTPLAAAGDELAETVLRIVTQLTGYPPELLDVDLDLEADLGVDTVKQAEIFAAIREHYGVARDDTLKLRDFPTLTHVIGWIRDKTGTPAPAPAAEAPAARRTGRRTGRCSRPGPGRAAPKRRRHPAGRRGHRHRRRHRLRAHRLPARPARRRPRPGSRPRRRHRQTGRDLRRDPRRTTASPATTPSSCATSRPSRTSSAGSATGSRPLRAQRHRVTPLLSPRDRRLSHPRSKATSRPPTASGAGSRCPRCAPASRRARRPGSPWPPAPGSR